MLGRFGKSIIGINHLTGATSDEEEKSARFEQHKVVRGKPVIQDLGDEARTKRLSFFFDESFADVEKELGKIELAFATRIPMRLFVNLIGLEIGVFLIESLSIRRQKTDGGGRVVRAEIDVSLLESSISLGGITAPGLIGRAVFNPLLKRG